jgi:hypothetical protein
MKRDGVSQWRNRLLARFQRTSGGRFLFWG